MTLRLNRDALAIAVRSSAGFRSLTREIERRTVKTAVQVADQRVKRRSGRYVGNFETTITPVHTKTVLARLRLFNTLVYAAIIERGSRPHVIQARRAKVLAFDVGGERVFANAVQHPGTKPQNVVRDALLRVAGGRMA